MAQANLAAHEEAREVRKAVGQIWKSVLGKLAREVRDVGPGEAVPEVLVKNLKVASDQLRLDYRLDPPSPEGEPTAGETPDNPLEGLRLVG